ncbi:hypothetical protein MMC30_005694 [Trapelia coarctata]|nr:hypothetical protein [Trapelia coarctata]
MATRRAVLRAVFPSSTKATIPTPSATPLLGSAPFGGASFVFSDPSPLDGGDRASERIRWERAWHSATSFLSLRDAAIHPVNGEDDFESLQKRWIKTCSAEVSSSIAYVVSERSEGRQLRASNREDNLIDWYTQELGRHYIQYQLPQALKILSDDSNSDQLAEVLQLLRISQAVYFHPLKQYVLSNISETDRYEFTKFQDGYDAMIAMSLSQSSFAKHLAQVLKRQGSVVLGLERDVPLQDENSMDVDQPSLIRETRNETLHIMKCVDHVGLGGAQAQRILAEVMSELLTTHVNSTFAGQWTSPSTIPAQLDSWVENHFARFAVEVLACLRKNRKLEADQVSEITTTDLENWKKRAIGDLGALRLRELFDIVVEWDNNSRGAIEDLKKYITTTAARLHLTTSFSTVISHRLLQPGASTAEILQVYICIIRAFAVLDPKGVLLDRLARPIRRYLRDRDDTAKIIVGGLLADATDESGSADVLVELAVELNKVTEIAGDDDAGELDWDDMNWVPDPVDAGPEYKKSKSHDVIGTLISLFDTKDIFVKEFQIILGERLLKPEHNFDKETRVLELLKLRFGDTPLQACEVMLKDIMESRRTDVLIQKRDTITTLPSPKPDIHAKILSRLFWPSLNADTFSIPPEVEFLQEKYSAAFGAIKPTRKLTWLQALGLVTVELHLQDRIIHEEVQTWQASVIYAFQDPPETPPSSTPASRTIDALTTTLSMERPLLLTALTFWVGKLVLREISPGTYQVLETLNPSDLQSSTASGANQATIAQAAAASAAAGTAAVKNAEDAVNEKMEEFWPFVVAMLTNQGAMPAGKIVMMLKMVVTGGFPYGVEEMKEFLRGRIEDGRVELVGGAYRVVR